MLPESESRVYSLVKQVAFRPILRVPLIQKFLNQL